MFRILVVDDQARIREGMRTILLKRQETMEIETAANGLEALSVLQRKKIHLVITDIRMPDMDGIALMESAARYYPDIPFVVVSGYDDFSYAQKAIEYGARAYLLKPLERTALLQAVDRIYGEYCVGRTKQEPELKDGIFTQMLSYLKGTGANPALVQKLKRDHSFLEQDYRVALFGFPERELDMQEEGIRLRLSILLERETERGAASIGKGGTGAGAAVRRLGKAGGMDGRDTPLFSGKRGSQRRLFRYWTASDRLCTGKRDWDPPFPFSRKRLPDAGRFARAEERFHYPLP